MNELIKINKENNTCNARDLWVFLESKQQFGNWIKNRIEKYHFVENIDFTVINFSINDDTSFSGVRKIVEYHISFDMAKELSMVENNDKGKEARQYFIDCENKLKGMIEDTKPKDEIDLLEKIVESNQKLVGYVKDLVVVKKQLNKAKSKIEKDEHKVVGYEGLLDKQGTFTIDEVAKLISKKGYIIGRNTLFTYLRDQFILDKKNIPYQKYMDNKYFDTKKVNVKITENYTEVKSQTVVTLKGIDYILKILTKEGLIKEQNSLGF